MKKSRGKFKFSKALGNNEKGSTVEMCSSTAAGLKDYGDFTANPKKKVD